jgi:alkylation response protein AidB-like acyl-CoA dehydrogenase
MDLRYSKDYEVFRSEVAAFLNENWPPRADEAKLERAKQAARFRERAIARGYLARSIPKRYGGSEQAAILRQEFSRMRAPGEMRGIGPSMLVPTLLDHGAEWQKERFIKPTMTGEMIWCQGYSEPGSGSDLASLATRAERVGDDWVINGQKIWTSGAHVAHMMFVLCRTEREASKHAGISYLLLDMKQPPITSSGSAARAGSCRAPRSSTSATASAARPPSAPASTGWCDSASGSCATVDPRSRIPGSASGWSRSTAT